MHQDAIFYLTITEAERHREPVDTEDWDVQLCLQTPWAITKGCDASQTYEWHCDGAAWETIWGKTVLCSIVYNTSERAKLHNYEKEPLGKVSSLAAEIVIVLSIQQPGKRGVYLTERENLRFLAFISLSTNTQKSLKTLFTTFKLISYFDVEVFTFPI